MTSPASVPQSFPSRTREQADQGESLPSRGYEQADATSPRSDCHYSPPRRLDPVRTALLVLAVPLAIAAWRAYTTAPPPDPLPDVQIKLDPNTAPWWELTLLPELGESTARAIVAYREAHADRAPVFRTPADLEPVPDIGPKTIQRIAPYLRFGE